MSEIELLRNSEVPDFWGLVPGVTNVDVSPRLGGVQVRVTFENGYGASVIQFPGSRGGTDGLWELAVLGRDGDLNYETPITSDTVGWLDDPQVLDYLRNISALTDADVGLYRRQNEAWAIAYELRALANRAHQAGVRVVQDDAGDFTVQDAVPGEACGMALVRIGWSLLTKQWEIL